MTSVRNARLCSIAQSARRGKRRRARSPTSGSPSKPTEASSTRTRRSRRRPRRTHRPLIAAGRVADRDVGDPGGEFPDHARRGSTAVVDVTGVQIEPDIGADRVCGCEHLRDLVVALGDHARVRRLDGEPEATFAGELVLDRDRLPESLQIGRAIRPGRLPDVRSRPSRPGPRRRLRRRSDCRRTSSTSSGGRWLSGRR